MPQVSKGNESLLRAPMHSVFVYSSSSTIYSSFVYGFIVLWSENMPYDFTYFQCVEACFVVQNKALLVTVSHAESGFCYCWVECSTKAN